MTSIRLGRVDLMDANIEWSMDGDSVTLRGALFGTGRRESEARRSRLLGYLATTDEPCVVLTWPDEPELNGYYRVDSVRVQGAGWMAFQGNVSWDVTLKRVSGYAAPLFESRLIGYPRVGADFVASRPWHGVPAAVKGYETNVLTPTQHIRPSETGDVAVLFMGDFDYYDASPQYYLPPEDWYTGAATLTVNGAEIVGTEPVNSPDGWELSNGIIRLVGEPDGWFRTERWNGSTWGDPGEWSFCRRVSSSSRPSLEAPHALTVLRNGPESTIIRLTTDAASSTTGYRFPVTIDIDLRRGALTADVLLRSRGAYSWKVVTPLTTDGDTSFDGGIAQGGFVVAYEDTHGALNEGGTYIVGPPTDVNQTNWGIGYYGTTTDDTPAQLARQWAAHQRENTRVIIR